MSITPDRLAEVILFDDGEVLAVDSDGMRNSHYSGPYQRVRHAINRDAPNDCQFWKCFVSTTGAHRIGRKEFLG